MIRPPPTSTLFPYTTLFRSLKTSTNAISLDPPSPAKPRLKHGLLLHRGLGARGVGVLQRPKAAQKSLVDEEYLRESNLTNTIADLFMNNTSNITWKYYDHPIQVGGYQGAVNSGRAFEYWNPFSAKGTTYTKSYAPHFVNRTQIF